MTVNAQLRRLREETRPRLTIRALAEMLNISPSAYHAYESERRFKQRFLPMDFALRLAPIFADRGVNPDSVMALAGMGARELSTPLITASEEQLLDAYRGLDGEARTLLLQMARRLSDGGGLPAASPTLHSPRSAYSPPPVRAQRA